MKLFLVLITTFLFSLIIIKFRQGRWHIARAARIAMATMLFFTAIGHFIAIPDMSRMMPDFISPKREMGYLIGILEIVLAIVLLIPKYRTVAAWALIIFFVLVLPANIKAALGNIDYLTNDFDGKEVFELWLRVPLQFCFILWVYFSTLKK